MCFLCTLRSRCIGMTHFLRYFTQDTELSNVIVHELICIARWWKWNKRLKRRQKNHHHRHNHYDHRMAAAATTMYGYLLLFTKGFESYNVSTCKYYSGHRPTCSHHSVICSVYRRTYPKIVKIVWSFLQTPVHDWWSGNFETLLSCASTVAAERLQNHCDVCFLYKSLFIPFSWMWLFRANI